MRISLRHLLAATAIGAATLATGTVPTPTLAQAAPKPAQAQPAPQEIALTQAQIDALLAAQNELVAIQGGDSDKPDPAVQAKVEAIAKKNGFAGAEELGAVSDSVEAVLAGIDTESKAYVGPTALIKRDIAAIQADKAMPAKDKATALKELKAALKAGDGPKPSAGNIALVAKNLDRLSSAQQGDTADAQ